MRRTLTLAGLTLLGAVAPATTPPVAAMAVPAPAASSSGSAVSPVERLHAAYAHLQQDRYQAALDELKGTESLAATHLAQPLIRARALRGLGRRGDARTLLLTAVEQFPAERAPKLELLHLSGELGLRTEVRTWAQALLKAHPERRTALAVLEALHDDPGALALMEEAAVRYPADGAVLHRLAHGYVLAGKHHAAALLFARAAAVGEGTEYEAADQFRAAGSWRRALRWNGRVAGEHRRLEQRLRILSDAGSHARVVGLTAEARRLGLGDPMTRYRFAYARYRLGQEGPATRLARGLLKSPLKDQAASLLRAMGRRLEADD